jgi:hypothetical protein
VPTLASPSDGKYKLPGLFMVGLGSFHFFSLFFPEKIMAVAPMYSLSWDPVALWFEFGNIRAILRSLVSHLDISWKPET